MTSEELYEMRFASYEADMADLEQLKKDNTKLMAFVREVGEWSIPLAIQARKLIKEIEKDHE